MSGVLVFAQAHNGTHLLLCSVCCELLLLGEGSHLVGLADIDKDLPLGLVCGLDDKPRLWNHFLTLILWGVYITQPWY